jgi:hypothetical protein
MVGVWVLSDPCAVRDAQSRIGYHHETLSSGALPREISTPKALADVPAVRTVISSSLPGHTAARR